MGAACGAANDHQSPPASRRASETTEPTAEQGSEKNGRSAGKRFRSVVEPPTATPGNPPPPISTTLQSPPQGQSLQSPVGLRQRTESELTTKSHSSSSISGRGPPSVSSTLVGVNVRQESTGGPPGADGSVGDINQFDSVSTYTGSPTRMDSPSYSRRRSQIISATNST